MAALSHIGAGSAALCRANSAKSIQGVSGPQLKSSLEPRMPLWKCRPAVVVARKESRGAGNYS